MRYSASEKMEIIRLVEGSSLPVRQTLRRLDIHKSTFYNWLKRFQDNGVNGLEDKSLFRVFPGTGFLLITEKHSLPWHWISLSCRLGN